jgi:hypothetical protein
METSDFAALDENEHKRDEAETARLLYVSCTRAGDLLVIPRTPLGGSYFEILADHLPGAGNDEPEPKGARAKPAGGRTKTAAAGGAPEARVVSWRVSELPQLRGIPRPFVRMPSVSAEEKRRAAAAKSDWLAEREKLIGRASIAPAVITPSKIQEPSSRRTQGALPAALEDSAAGGISAAVECPVPGNALLIPGDGGGETETVAGESGVTMRDEALRFGSAFHRLMEVIDLNDECAVAEAARSAAEEFRVGDAAGGLETLARKAFSSDLLRSAARASSVYREVPFTVQYRLDDGGDAPGGGKDVHFIEGRIDLLFEADGCWTLVDYKTDDVSGDEVDRRFRSCRGQGIIYAAAMHRLGIELGGGIVFYFVRPDEVRTLAVTPELLGEADGLVRSTVRGAVDSEERQ